MNWLEAFQAMSEGKTVADSHGTLYRIYKGEFQHKFQDSTLWFRNGQFINDWIEKEYELAIEYNLTFIEAMNEIQKGNKVECRSNPGELVYLDKYDNVICSTVFGELTPNFDVYKVRAKWRVVEEEE